MHSHAVDLWTVDLTEPRPNLLSADESARAARFRFDADRVRWTRAHSALRAILASYTGTAPELLEFTTGAHGKPALAGFSLEFNLSHAGDYAMIAVSEAGPTGVDIERIREDIDIAALLHRLGEQDLPDTIPALYTRWTRREAKSKAAGGLLFTPPPPDTNVIDIAAPEGYTAAVATVGYQPQITYRNSL